jgi:hypothetical protein
VTRRSLVHQAWPLVSSLPAGVDGQEVYYLADATNGVIWHLRYRAASASAYKWEFVDGSSLAAFVATVQTTAISWPTFVDLATAGPQIKVPLAGEYHAEGSHISYVAGGPSSSYARLMVNGVAVPAGLNGAANLQEAFQAGSASRTSNFTTGIPFTCAAGAIAKMQYSATGGVVASYMDRSLRMRPVRVG